jgi:hypothetical protein
MRLRDIDSDARFEVAHVASEMSEDGGALLFRISKQDLIVGDELRIDIMFLGDDDAG